jgi:hypothetical protein
MFTIDPSYITDLTRIQNKLAQLPPQAIDAGLEMAGNYLLNVLVNKEIPPYSYVSRAEAYGDMGFGPGWFSDKQRRYVMAAIHDGRITIPYDRGGTYGIQSRWRIEGAGAQRTLTNDSPGAPWVYSDPKPPRQLAMVGWLGMELIIEKYKTNLYQSFMRGVNNAITKLGLK